MKIKLQYIREWRKFVGLTQAKLAPRLGITRSQLSRNETDDRLVDLEVLSKMAEVFGCLPYEILARDPSKTADISAVWSSLNEHEQRQGIQMLRALKTL